MVEIRRKWLGTEKEKTERHLSAPMGSHGTWPRTYPTWPRCFEGNAVTPPRSPEHQGQHLRSPALKAELPWSLQAILEPESLSFNESSSLLITTISACLKSWTGEDSSLQAVKCNDECGIKTQTNWNKRGLTWYSEKQHNTFYICLKYGKIHCCRSLFITWAYLLS